MSRTASRNFGIALGFACFFAFAAPAAAQKPREQPEPQPQQQPQQQPQPQPQQQPQAQPQQPQPQQQVPSQPPASTRTQPAAPEPAARPAPVRPDENAAPARSSTAVRPGENVAPQARPTPAEDNAGRGAVRVNVSATRSGRIGDEPGSGMPQRAAPERPGERADQRRGDWREWRYGDGLGRGDDSVENRGYSSDYWSTYSEVCPYGLPCGAVVFGWYYGGRALWGGVWHHFEVVGGYPVYVGDDWDNWDGWPTNLVCWACSHYAPKLYPATYSFEPVAGCAVLWVRATDGGEYVFRADPQQWGAADSGELDALLWAQIERDGYLQVEDVNGVVQIFPAGAIQEIEVAACR